MFEELLGITVLQDKGQQTTTWQSPWSLVLQGCSNAKEEQIIKEQQ